ncbi:bacteriocin-like protein [Chryseobacterium bernardetii]|jgi:bacteriocin-like protein|uniref:Bacteriocin-like protein n=3 Tax=Chryseobacterium TaxID=59732 RepID=A0A543EKC6_9FLAO|nr:MULTISPECIES: bacteriocin [Chryseobacterium]MDR6372042.1 bacteriocin-like protein [Chryseobacterium vietnamense]MDR6442575.1 bacteriocin-like protein [Chryseobacterium bernardetii]MDR6458493.1 bacteriocin-like protein [Chryseobacterium vietnamense]MDR6487111.1 bacteriocin-like protein [Chryseobacterium vietnamense]TQM22044.1 bacteriocin-like protein [Chryseobacterium aquifrigidense]
MRKQISEIGKKLNKKELRTIKGGLINCMEPVLCPTPCEPSSDPYGCTIISPKCAQKECRPQL